MAEIFYLSLSTGSVRRSFCRRLKLEMLSLAEICQMCLFEFIHAERDVEFMKPVKGDTNCKRLLQKNTFL
jgi:hypothetical protein